MHAGDGKRYNPLWGRYLESPLLQVDLGVTGGEGLVTGHYWRIARQQDVVVRRIGGVREAREVKFHESESIYGQVCPHKSTFAAGGLGSEPCFTGKRDTRVGDITTRANNSAVEGLSINGKGWIWRNIKQNVPRRRHNQSRQYRLKKTNKFCPFCRKWQTYQKITCQKESFPLN